MTDDASDMPRAAPGQARGQAMWGGRFSEKPAELMQAINVSIGFDRRLAAQDIRGSRAHAAMLAKTGLISSEDARRSKRAWRPSSARSRRGCSRSARNTRTST